jgi:hypothetical protein
MSRTEKGKKLVCDHVVAFHIGHTEIKQSEATEERILDDCCGGVKLLKYCPECGHKNIMPLWYQIRLKSELSPSAGGEKNE